MFKAGASWSLLFIVGIIFITIGIQGSGGKVLACLTTPASIEVTSYDA